MVDDTDRLVGRIIADRYRIESEVSTGASAVITVALDQQNNQPVTLKIVHPRHADRPGFGAEFVRRCEAAAALAHPNIAAVLEWGEVDLSPHLEDSEPTWYWVTEYLAGGSLRDLLDRGRLLEPSQALVVGLEACRALDVAHQRGIIHAELTPSKLVFGDDRRLRVIDFGLAELLGSEAWENPANVPTHVARYASPEQALGMEIDPTTDVYALSLIMIESLTGVVPFAGDSTMSTLAGRVGKLMPVSADLGGLAVVLEKAGRPDCEDRSTAAEFGRGLVQAAETLPRPDPIPIISTGLFTATIARQPDDPTGGTERPLLPGPEQPDPEQPDPEQSRLEQPRPEQPDLDSTQPLVVLTDIADEPQPEFDQPASEQRPPLVPTQELVVAATEPVPVAATLEATASAPPNPVIYDEEGAPRKRFKIIVATMLVLLAVGALGFAAWLVFRTKSYEVPDLVGVQEDIALNQVSGNDWKIQREITRSDAFPEPGTVVRTTPAAGVKLDAGDTFVMFVSEGPELRVLPEFTGMALADAQARLTELRLVAVEAEQQFSEDVPAGSVISWTVQGDTSLTAGAKVLPDTSIVLVVSKGPAPRPAPNLTNLPLDQATAALAAVQLVIAQGDPVFSNDIPVGNVVTQTPAPDTPVERGGTVTVQLSKGPDLVPFPDLTGQTYPQAQATLAAAGYGVNSLLGSTTGVFVSASVGGQPVTAGQTFVRGTAVDVVFL